MDAAGRESDLSLSLSLSRDSPARLEDEFRSPDDLVAALRRDTFPSTELPLSRGNGIDRPGAKVSRPCVILIGLMPTSYNASALFFRRLSPSTPIRRRMEESPSGSFGGLRDVRAQLPESVGHCCWTRSYGELHRDGSSLSQFSSLLSSLFYRIAVRL